MTITTEAPTAFAAAWEAWHADHEARRADPHGFLAVTGLHRLTPESQRIEGIPGSWSSGPDGVVVELAAGESLTRDAEPLTARVVLGRIAERDGILLRHGDVEVEVARRGGTDIVRPRDPAHLAARGYDGTDAYPADERWAVDARYEPFDVPRPTTVGSVAPGLEHVYDAPGQIVLELDGTEHRLTVFGAGDGFFALFTDATSGVTTYPANRSLSIPGPEADGRVVVDFNRAVNLPCAYTAFATCPLPPAENRLPIAIEAGELLP
ncbi:DUF1684 domain-containing protein [uncultured Amnibacterium sp.]|uniref:DUF1684 domain-containing protein n=1 Tax=uncultured Amnibacterium sp. TaxID=1631851 RepID=UPI0035CA477B